MTRRIKNPPPEIPTVEDYAHWNEDAELMWYQENKYDMENYEQRMEEWASDPENFYDEPDVEID